MHEETNFQGPAFILPLDGSAELIMSFHSPAELTVGRRDTDTEGRGELLQQELGIFHNLGLMHWAQLTSTIWQISSLFVST